MVILPIARMNVIADPYLVCYSLANAKLIMVVPQDGKENGVMRGVGA